MFSIITIFWVFVALFLLDSWLVPRHSDGRDMDADDWRNYHENYF